jgi:peroxiredoxin
MEQILIASSILLWVVVVFNLLLTLALVRRFSTIQRTPEVETLEVGQPAPDFAAEALDGRTVTLGDFEGRSLALIFVSPTCSPCIEKLPTLQALEPKANQNGVEMLLVYKTELAETQTAVAKHGVTLSTVAAPQRSNPFWRDYLVAGTPFYCLLDEEHKVLSAGFFGSDWHSLAQKWSTNGSD